VTEIIIGVGECTEVSALALGGVRSADAPGDLEEIWMEHFLQHVVRTQAPAVILAVKPILALSMIGIL
jgi:hypothetical protein